MVLIRSLLTNMLAIYVTTYLVFGIKIMYTQNRIYYSVEVKDEEDDTFLFLCSYSTFTEAKQKLEELESSSDKEYRILKVEKSIEEVS